MFESYGTGSTYSADLMKLTDYHIHTLSTYSLIDDLTRNRRNTFESVDGGAALLASIFFPNLKANVHEFLVATNDIPKMIFTQEANHGKRIGHKEIGKRI
jgi:hypothetical protein